MIGKGMSLVVVSAMLLAGIAGCSTEPKTETGMVNLHNKVNNAVAQFKQLDPSIDKFFGDSAGYAVFPDVAAGSFVVGGAGGKGELIVNGTPVGFCHISKANVGAQVGGQEYMEIIFFENQDALNRFKEGNFALSASASAVILKSGASANAKYAEGVAVFTHTIGGAEVSAAVGGQKFSYEPMGDQDQHMIRSQGNNPSTMPNR